MTRHLPTYIFILTFFVACGQSTKPKISNDSIPTTLEISNGKDNYEYFSIVDTNYTIYKLPKNFEKPNKWKEEDKKRSAKYYVGYGNSYSNTFDLKNALSYIDTAKEFSQVCSVKSWCIDNYEQVFPFLVVKLSDKRKIGLTNTADLIIGDRMNTGDLKFYGHGGGMTEDIFTIAGRASWILNELTGEDFAIVHGNLTQQDAKWFKVLWAKYIDKLKK
ncbi:MAG: hypothetical protein U0T73_03255 [Chitinophagales bacterium]